MSYAARLRRLNVPSLELRRLHLDLIYCYKIVFGVVDLKFFDFFAFSPTSKTRGHRYKLFRAFSCSVRSRFFTERVIWNCLPQTVNFGNLPAFKRSVTRVVDFSMF